MLIMATALHLQRLAALNRQPQTCLWWRNDRGPEKGDDYKKENGWMDARERERERDGVFFFKSNIKRHSAGYSRGVGTVWKNIEGRWWTHVFNREMSHSGTVRENHK